MSRVQTNPDFFKQVKTLEQRISRLERVASTTTLKDVNTTGLTSAQIDAAVFAGSSTPSVGAQAADGLIISDETNGKLLVRQSGVWESYVNDTSNHLALRVNSWSATSYSGIAICTSIFENNTTLATYSTTTGLATIVKPGTYLLSVRQQNSGATGEWTLYINGSSINNPNQTLPAGATFAYSCTAGMTIGVGSGVSSISGLSASNSYYGGWDLVHI